MFFQIFIIASSLTILLLNFCATTPILQNWPHLNNCPETHFMQNNVCVLRGVSAAPIAQPCQTVNNCQAAVQCSTSCCQTNCQPPCQQPCQQPCPLQTQMQMPMPVQISTPIHIPVPVPMPYPVTQYPATPSPLFPPTPSQTTTPPNIIVTCGNGTILIDGSCHLIYCGIGIYRDGKCVVVDCPEGTIWNGKSCQIPEAQNHTTIILHTDVVTININETDRNRDLNYTNNISVNITDSQIDESQPPSPPIVVVVPPQPQPRPQPPRIQFIPVPAPRVQYIPSPSPPQYIFPPAPVPAQPRPQPQPPIIVQPPPQFILPPAAVPAQPPPQPQPQPPFIVQSPPQIMYPPPVQPHPSPNCCIVTTPNACRWEDRYVCRSHTYQQCGSICSSHGYVNLRPPVVRQPPESCINSDCGYHHQPFYPDCSGCSGGSEMMTGSYCQTFCQNTGCKNTCSPLDLTTYCDSYPGAIGCRQEDGYRLDWTNDLYS